MIRLISFCPLIACAALAQETPTEREAARDVLRNMSELEKSIDVPWMPPDFELIRAEGDGPVQPAVSAALAATDTARAHRVARNLRRRSCLRVLALSRDRFE